MRDVLALPKKYFGYLRLTNPKETGNFFLGPPILSKIKYVLNFLRRYLSVADAGRSLFFRECVFPSPPYKYSADFCWPASNFFCYASLRHSFLAEAKNPKNLAIGQFRHAVGFSTSLSSFSYFIGRIIGLSPKKEMLWIYARRIVATVKNEPASWYRPDMKFPRNAMSLESDASAFDKTIASPSLKREAQVSAQ